MPPQDDRVVVNRASTVAAHFRRSIIRPPADVGLVTNSATVTLTRKSPTESFGFVLGETEPEHGMHQVISRVGVGGTAADVLVPGDRVTAINGAEIAGMPHDAVLKLINGSMSVMIGISRVRPTGHIEAGTRHRAIH